MPATAQDVRNVDMTNVFGTIDDAQISCVLADQVPCYVNEAAWGSCATLAQALVAAHLMVVALQGESGSAGPVVSESAGGVSRSYAAPSITSGSSFWSTSSFGLRYLQLLSTRMTTPITLTADIAVATVV